MSVMKQAPIGVEQWLSYVIALQSHRSTNAGQHAFGERLMQRLFETVPARYSEDPVAAAYFDNALAEVSWAVRGFSVAQDIFRTNARAEESARQAEANHIESLRRLAPFSSESIWGKLKGSLVGIGVFTPLLAIATRAFGTAPLVWVLASACVAAVGLLAMELFIGAYVHRRLTTLQRAAPAEVMTSWQRDAMKSYKEISRTFVWKIDAVNRHFYPPAEGSPTLTQSDVDQILTRAFSLASS
jgi:hypothetical protein